METRLEHLPQLEEQRRLLDVPRGRERFAAYLELMTGSPTGKADQLVRPLTLFNPMSKEHVAERLDGWIALGAEDMARDTIEQLPPDLAAAWSLYTSALEDPEGDAPAPPKLRTALVLVDDAAGGWTDRWLTDFDARFGDHHLPSRGWAQVVLWSSEEPQEELVRRRVVAAAWRAWAVGRRGLPRTLDDMMRRDGLGQRLAGRKTQLEAEDLAYTREVLEPLRMSRDRPVQVAAFYGDEAARDTGYTPLGLSARAGFELALHETPSL